MTNYIGNLKRRRRRAFPPRRQRRRHSAASPLYIHQHDSVVNKLKGSSNGFSANK
jgi:hypothetical protein